MKHILYSIILINITHIFSFSQNYISQAFSNIISLKNDETRYLLDSMYNYNWNNYNNIWEPIIKQLNLYNTANNVIDRTWYEYNSGAWTLQSKDEIEYDEQGNTIDFTHKYYHSGELVFSFRYTQNYNENGNLNEVVNYNWDELSNDWKHSSRQLYYYSDSNKLTEVLSYNWDNNLNTWEETSKTEYDEYNDTVQKYITYNWNSSADLWEYSSKGTTKYNSENLLTEITLYQWDTEQDRWIGNFSLEISYNDPVTIATFYTWNDTISNWKPQDKNYTMHDPLGNQIKSLSIYRDSESEDWIIRDKTSYITDPNGNNIRHKSSSWDSWSNSMKESQLTDYFYDNESNCVESINKTWDSYQMGWKQTRRECSYWSPVKSEGLKSFIREYNTSFNVLNEIIESQLINKGLEQIYYRLPWSVLAP